MMSPSHTPPALAAPSIIDLFAQAKKLLALQPRMENRQWRKDGASAQHSRTSGAPDENPGGKTAKSLHHQNSSPTGVSDLKGLNLLLPLLVDDMHSMLVPVCVLRKTIKPENVDITPSSMDDSPPTVSQSGEWTKPARQEQNESTNVYMKPQTSQLTSSLQRASNNNAEVSGKRDIAMSDSGIVPGVRTGGFNSAGGLHNTGVPNAGGVTSGVSPNVNSGPSRLNSGASCVRTSDTSGINPASRTNMTSSKPGSRMMQIPGMIHSGVPLRPVKPTECSNCHTLKTPLWRKDPAGNTLCNACGLFYKLHGTTRPLSLKTDVIKKRSLRRLSNTPGNTTASTPSSLTPSEDRRPDPSPSPYNGYGLPHEVRPKNVPILPKPASLVGSTPGSFSKTPQMYMSTPSSPYSAGAMQFKRKKSDVNINDMSRIPSLLTMSASGTPTIKRGFLATSINRRTSLTNLRKQSATPTQTLSLGQGLSRSFNQSQSFSQSQGFSQSQSFGHGFNQGLSQSQGFALGLNQSHGSEILYQTPQGYGTTPNRLLYQSSSYFDNTRDMADTPISVPLPSSYSSSGQVTARPSFTAPSELASYQRYTAKSKDIDTDDDFFRNYTSINTEGDDDVAPMDDSTIPAMGGRYEIKPTNTTSSLTNGLKEVSQRGMIANYNDANENGDLDWLKFGI